MSIEVIVQVWKKSPSRNGERLVLLAFANYANDQNKAWPSVKSVAAIANLSERATQYAIKGLMKRGELVFHEGIGPHGCNMYDVVPGGAISAPVQNATRGGAKCDIGGVQNATKRGADIAPNPSIETSIRNIKETKSNGALMEDDANAQSVASFSSHSDLVGEEAKEQSRAEAEQKPSKGRKSVTPDTRKRMEGLAKRFYEVHPKKGFFDLNAEITKYHDELAWAVGRDLTPDLMENATRNAIARLKPPFQITLKVVLGEVEQWLAAPLKEWDTPYTEFQDEGSPRKINNAERFRQMAENGGMPEL